MFPIEIFIWWFSGAIAVYVPLQPLAKVLKNRSPLFSKHFSGNNHWLLFLLSILTAALWPITIPALGLVISFFMAIGFVLWIDAN